VIDATAKHQDVDSVLLQHAPGFSLWYEHDSGLLKQSVAPVENSGSYYPKKENRTSGATSRNRNSLVEFYALRVGSEFGPGPPTLLA
jgi:hypothetical protein